MNHILITCLTIACMTSHSPSFIEARKARAADTNRHANVFLMDEAMAKTSKKAKEAEIKRLLESGLWVKDNNGRLVKAPKK